MHAGSIARDPDAVRVVAMRAPGTGEILLILILCAVVFSASKVNALGDALGRFWRNLKHGLRDDPRIAVKPQDPDPKG